MGFRISFVVIDQMGKQYDSFERIIVCRYMLDTDHVR